MKTIFYSGEEKKDEPLVIPLLGSKTWHDRIINKVDADIFVSKTTKEKTENIEVDDKGEKSKLSNGKSPPKISIKKEVVEDNENKVVTLEEQAAKEIIQELKSKDEQETKPNDLSLPLVEDESLKGKEQVHHCYIQILCTNVLYYIIYVNKYCLIFFSLHWKIMKEFLLMLLV